MMTKNYNCLGLQCEVKTNDCWVSFQFDFSYWFDRSFKNEREVQTSVIQYTKRILKKRDQTVYHSVYQTNDNN